MIPVQLIVAMVIAAIGFGSGWVTQGWRADAAISKVQSDYLKRDFRALENAHAATISLQTAKDEAERKHQVRLADLRRDIARTRSTADGLRNDLAAAHAAVHSATCGSVREYAAALNTVFSECTTTVESLAGQAAGHAADALMLLDAWPKLPRSP